MSLKITVMLVRKTLAGWVRYLANLIDGMQTEVRLDDNEKLDEIVGAAPFHLERLDKYNWWMSLDGIHVNFKVTSLEPKGILWRNENEKPVRVTKSTEDTEDLVHIQESQPVHKKK